MKAHKDAQKRLALKNSTVSGGAAKRTASATSAIGSGKKKKKGDTGSKVGDDATIKFQPHRDVIDAGKIVKELGDNVNTRYRDHDDLDQLDAGLGLNHDAEGQLLIDEARTAAGDRRLAVIADVRGHLFGKQYASGAVPIPSVLPPHIESKVAFVGHNRNTVTCCAVLDMTVFYGDKTGHVFRAEPNLNYSRADNNNKNHLTTSTQQQEEYFYQRIAMNPKHKGAVLSLAISDTRGNRPANWGKERSSVDMSVLNYLVSGGQDGAIHVWRAVSGEYVGILKMHRSPVTGLCFRQWSSMLVSASTDTTVRLWSVPEMHCEDKFFGHNGPVNGISSLRKERCATAGADRTVRHWKLDAATQVEFSTEGSAAECVAMIDDVHIVAGTTSGQLFLFDVNRRNPLQTVNQPHGAGFVGDGTGLEMLEGSPSPLAASRGNAITAIAALPYGDLVATASYSGAIALWHFSGRAATNDGAAKRGVSEIASSSRPANRLELIATIPCKGCVNSLQFSPDGSVLIGSVGKDQRTGRWLTVSSALNGVIIIPLHKKGEDEVSAVTATSPISALSSTAANSAASAIAARKIHAPLINDPSHYPMTEEAKLEARRKKRKELLAKRKAARDAAKDANKNKKGADDDESDEGDAIDNWDDEEAEVEIAAPSKKKAVVEKKNGATKAVAAPAVVVPSRVPDEEDDEDDFDGMDDDFSDNSGDADENGGFAFKLGKDGQFVVDDDEGSDAEDEIVSRLKKGTAAAGGKKAKIAKKSSPASRKSESLAGGKKKKAIIGKKRK